MVYPGVPETPHRAHPQPPYSYLLPAESSQGIQLMEKGILKHKIKVLKGGKILLKEGD